MRRSLPQALVLSAVIFPCGPLAGGPAGAGDAERGQIVAKRARHGEYLRYLPRQEASGVLVIVHGQPTEADAKNVVNLAERFLKRWVAFAEEQRLVALAPAFDDENSDSVNGVHGGGYRGLFGRQVGADEFVNEVLEESRPCM